MSDPLDPRLWSDPWWRICNLYTGVNDDGQEFRFTPNDEQAEFYRGLWTRNIALKARQLGFTTFIALLILDQCLFNKNFTGAVIAHTLSDAEKIFRNKVLNVYRRLPQWVRDLAPLQKETTSELVFANGSAISVSTSSRGGTVNFLHVSEMGKIARKYPEKAREIVSGAFESVPKDGIIVVESTAEGRDGWFYKATQEAMRQRDQGSRLTQLDFRLHFFPWWRKAAYQIESQGVIFTDEDERYFDRLEQLIGRRLSREQRAWYVKKRAVQQDDMKREYPSTEDEAFEQSTEGVIFAKEMRLLRSLGRIGRVPVRAGIVIDTYWDLGLNDTNTIWLRQRVGAMNRFVKYLAGSNEGMRYYAERLETWRLAQCVLLGGDPGAVKWGKHYLPHDGDQRIQGYEVKTRRQILEEDCGFRDIKIVPRVADKRDAIAAARLVFAECEFDEECCTEGIKCLDHYMREWNEDRGEWASYPRHDWASHGADSFLTFAQSQAVDTGWQGMPRQTAVKYGRGGY